MKGIIQIELENVWMSKKFKKEILKRVNEN